VRFDVVVEAERTPYLSKAIAEYVGARYAVAVPSCTIALAVQSDGAWHRPW